MQRLSQLAGLSQWHLWADGPNNLSVRHSALGRLASLDLVPCCRRSSTPWRPPAAARAVFAAPPAARPVHPSDGSRCRPVLHRPVLALCSGRVVVAQTWCRLALLRQFLAALLSRCLLPCRRSPRSASCTSSSPVSLLNSAGGVSAHIWLRRQTALAHHHGSWLRLRWLPRMRRSVHVGYHVCAGYHVFEAVLDSSGGRHYAGLDAKYMLDVRS